MSFYPVILLLLIALCCSDFWPLLIHPEGVRSPYLCVVFMLQHYITYSSRAKVCCACRSTIGAKGRSWSSVGDKTALKRLPESKIHL